jgi:hypothetical protein
MSTTYKQFTPQDYSIIPFNAHKQYDFTSASAASNRVTYFNTQWDSTFVSSYNSGTVKYNQIDHLFYRNFKKIKKVSPGAEYMGQHNLNYLKHKRVLYKEANILSIPAGLYGYEIKPTSLYISSSKWVVCDDGYGNLIELGTDIDQYNTDIRSNILNIGPVKGFKRYDLNVYEGYGVDGDDQYFYSDGTLREDFFYLDGLQRVNRISSYSTPEGDEHDDSYFFNLLKYKKVNFSEQTLMEGNFPCIDFKPLDSSSLMIEHKGDFNFNKGNDFTINFWANVSQSATQTSYLISKSTTKTGLPPSMYVQLHNSASTPYPVPYFINSEPQFPFEIYTTGNTLYFSRSDGTTTTTISSSFSTGSMQHVTCRVSSSTLAIFINGIASGTSGSDNTTKQTQNTANIYIGNKGGNSDFLSGSMSQINIFNVYLSNTQILNHYSSSNGSPYVGNAFYQNGFATITHPKYIGVLNNIGTPGKLNQIKFQGSHQIYENEYQCTVEEHEFNFTTNISARKLKSINEDEMAGFQTSSMFQPYITTIGLYNKENELLVVGKTAQPIRTSFETDTTFILRWDT